MNKGFTLLELLIVIGILAILATTTILVLNPAELLRQARDSQRVTDLATLNSALGFYVVNVAALNLGNPALCYVHADEVFFPTAVPAAVLALGPTGCGGRHGAKTNTVSISQSPEGGGWIPVNFGAISGGSPLAVLPIDPSNTATLFYSYSTSGNVTATFELNAVFESIKYLETLDLDGRDGGNNPGVYEIGTEPGLDI